MSGAAQGGPGPTVGRYAILDEIAAGGMATVHLARVLDAGRLPERAHKGEFVAVKRMHASYAKDPSFRSMFIDEGRLCTRIHHANVVETIDVIEESGELLLVMELVDGESLSRLAKQASSKQTRIPIPIVGAVVRDVLLGLHAAHEAVSENGEPLQIVHRDVSPHNVMVSTDGLSRVLDFGVAKARGRMQQTREGQIKGKLAYMSPEQARGKNIDRRSDLFATAIILWELLIGERLFDGENEASILTQILTEKPPNLSERYPELRPYDAFVEQALASKPDDRFVSALAMAEALEGIFPIASSTQVADYIRAEAADAISRRDELLSKYRVPIAPASQLRSSRSLEVDDHTTNASPAGSPPHLGSFLNEPSQPTNPIAPRWTGPNVEKSSEWRDVEGIRGWQPSPPSIVGGARVGRSEPPPMHSQVSSVSLTTTGLPPRLAERRVRQLTWIGLATAAAVALGVTAVLVIVAKKPWTKSELAPLITGGPGAHPGSERENARSAGTIENRGPIPIESPTQAAPPSTSHVSVPAVAQSLAAAVASADSSAATQASSEPATDNGAAPSAAASASAKPPIRLRKKTDYGF